MSALGQREADDVDQGLAGPGLRQLLVPDLTEVEPEREEHRAGNSPEAVRELEDREKAYRRLLGLGDALASLGTLLIASAISDRAVSWGVAFVPLFAVLVAKIEGLYDRDDHVVQKTNIAEWRTIVQTAAMTSIGVDLGWRVITNAPRAGGIGLFSFLVLATSALTVAMRFIARRLARRITSDERCVIVGDPRRTVALAQRLDAIHGVELVGIIPEQALTGSVAQLHDVVDGLRFHRLVVAPSSEPDSSTLHLIQAAKFIGVRVSLVPSVMTAVGGFAVIEELDGMTLLGVPRFGLSRSSNALKRIFDVVVGAGVLIAAGPLMLAIAAAVKLDTKGSVLFRQTRVGRDGRPFEILKFRSMVDGADAMKADLIGFNEASGGLFKIAADPRITRTGRHIRSTHLDELPQLINVLRGEMSLVGPRPLVAEEDARVTGRDRHRSRLTPGMTGPWQVRGPMNTPLADMATLDYRYASAWSIWTDLDILIRTASRVLGRAGH